MLMRFTFGVIFRYSFFHVDRQDHGGVFQTVARNVFVAWLVLVIMESKSPRHVVGGGHDVRCLRGVVADCSRHSWDWSSWFCVRSGMWITTIIQLRTWIVDTGIAHTQETSQTTHLDISSDIRSKKNR